MGKTLFIAEKYKVAQKLLKSPRFKNLKKGKWHNALLWLF